MVQIPLGTAASGVVHLDEPNPNGNTRAMLARDQNHLGRGALSMRPSQQVMVEPDDGRPATRQNAVHLPPSAIGLGMRPIMVQRGEDAPLVESPIDGTAASMQRFTQETQENGGKGVIGVSTPDAPVAPVVPEEQPPAPEDPPVPPAQAARTSAEQKRARARGLRATLEDDAKAKPTNQRVRLKGSKMGRVTLFVRDVVVSDTLLVIVFPMDGSSAIVEPPKGETLDVEVNGKTIACVSNEFAFERGNEMFLVLLRLPGA